jgi:CBS domain-containing protein
MFVPAPQVKDFMMPNPVTIHATESVETAIKLMEEHQISGLPVVNEQNHVLGILSEGDLLVRESPLQPPLYMTILGSIIYFESPAQFHQHIKKALGLLVQDIMTAKPITITPQAPLSEAAHLMMEKRINRLPVVDDTQTLVGIITRHDLVRALKPHTFATS